MASAKTVEKTMEILQLISKYPNGLTLTEIYKELNLPKVTVYDILKRLYDQEAVYYRDYHYKRYAIGPKMFSIGQAFLLNSNFYEPVIKDLNEYAHKYDITVFASTRMKDQAIYVYKCMGENVRLNTKGVGEQILVTECPDGKCYLAFDNDQNDNELKAYVKETFLPKEKDEAEYNTLMSLLLKAREKGYFEDDGFTENFVFAVAFPIFNFEEKMVGVISACRIKNEKTDKYKLEQIQGLKDISNKVSKYLGYHCKK